LDFLDNQYMKDNPPQVEEVVVEAEEEAEVAKVLYRRTKLCQHYK
jgi:hypothetical protein